MKSAPQLLIDKYLRSELTKEELLSFQSELSRNPEFAKQVEFDQVISDGITNLRKAELKTRLETISVGVGWFGLGYLTKSTLLKISAAVVVLSVGVFSSYFILDSTKEPLSKPLSSIKYISSSEISFPVLQETTSIVIPERTSVEKVKTPESNSNVSENFEGIKELITVAANNEKNNSMTKKVEFIPNINLPSVSVLIDEGVLNVGDANLPEISAYDQFRSSSEDAIEVETVFKKNSEIRYKYFEGKLFLYGDFKSSPYELLEINGKEDKKLYLFHDHQYFEISITGKVQELESIANSVQIRELDIIRNNKTY